MNAIIFGASGQDGFYLKALLISLDIDVTGISRSGNFLRTDITSFDEVSSLIKNLKPNFIFHLAANSTTSHNVLFENHQTILTGTLNILEAAYKFSPHTKVFLSGSGLQFVNAGHPIKESDAFAPSSTYSVSRISSVYAARYYRTLGLKVYVGYFFNHDSPLRSERHVTKKITEAAIRIKAGSNEKLEIGDLSVVKEWAFAGDIVKGIWLLVSQDEIYEANISNGIAYSIKQWVDVCFKIINKNPAEYITENPTFKSQFKKLVSDNSLIKSLGYAPIVPFEQLATMMIYP